MVLSQKQKDIIELWEHNYTLNQIKDKGFSKFLIDETLDRYTRYNARKWLKEK